MASARREWVRCMECGEEIHDTYCTDFENGDYLCEMCTSDLLNRIAKINVSYRLIEELENRIKDLRAFTPDPEYIEVEPWNC